eukprot:scaffold301369_cov54-Prasinocladus_malaysianus.AAC.3
MQREGSNNILYYVLKSIVEICTSLPEGAGQSSWNEAVGHLMANAASSEDTYKDMPRMQRLDFDDPGYEEFITLRAILDFADDVLEIVAESGTSVVHQVTSMAPFGFLIVQNYISSQLV